MARVVFHWRLHRAQEPGFDVSHLFYARHNKPQYQAIVKVHGVFPSWRGNVASSPRLQVRRVCCRDRAQVVTRFMRVGTYPTRNFATLGPS
jgi:hypothetical protein